jgi:hypothetical protein
MSFSARRLSRASLRAGAIADVVEFPTAPPPRALFELFHATGSIVVESVPPSAIVLESASADTTVIGARQRNTGSSGVAGSGSTTRQFRIPRYRTVLERVDSGSVANRQPDLVSLGYRTSAVRP